jgi:3-dehydroquinate synthase
VANSSRPTWGLAMSASFDIAASTGTYKVSIESGVFHRYLAGLDSAAVIADQFFEPTFQQLALFAIFVPAHETNKSLDASPALIEQMRRSGANRQTHIVAVGGGIIQDLSAFIASVYMRGLQWSYVPTTVLAMVDSCIGGKSSINVGPYKNLVGTIHPPSQVLIDPSLALTLPADDQSSGLIEAAKICFCHGAGCFERHISYAPRPGMSTEALEAVIVNSLMAKKHFIEVDEFDRGERLLLNFGHTFGHAIEGASHYAIPHGIAVGVGILCALEFQRRHGVDYSNTPAVRLLEDHLDAMLRPIRKLGADLRAVSLDEVFKRFESDKKHGSENYTLILVSAGGEVQLQRFAKSFKIQDSVQNAIQTIVEKYS